MSEQKMMDLLAQGYSIKQIAEMLGRDEDFVQEVTGEGWGQFDFRTLIGKKVLVKAKMKEPNSGRVSIGTSTAVVKEISPFGDRVLLEYPKPGNMSLWAEAKNLKIVRQLDDEKDSGKSAIPAQVSEELTIEPEAGKEPMRRSARGVSTTPVEAVDISPQLKSFCSDYINALGIALDVVIRVGHEEYEAGFNEAMYIISKGGPGLHGRNPFRFGVPEKDRPRMLAEIERYADEAGIPYNKLSPLNQFIVTIPPYVFYCFDKYLPDDPGLREEARRLMNTKGFPRYLQEELGYPISQRIKGAFWKPNPFGTLARLFSRGRRH